MRDGVETILGLRVTHAPWLTPIQRQRDGSRLNYGNIGALDITTDTFFAGQEADSLGEELLRGKEFEFNLRRRIIIRSVPFIKAFVFEEIFKIENSSSWHLNN